MLRRQISIPATRTLDEMATILSTNGYVVLEGRIDEETWRTIGHNEGYVMPPRDAEIPRETRVIISQVRDTQEAPHQETVFEHCAEVDRLKQWGGGDALILAILGQMGILPDAPYAAHADELALRYPVRWPATPREAYRA